MGYLSRKIKAAKTVRSFFCHADDEDFLSNNPKDITDKTVRFLSESLKYFILIQNIRININA